MYELENDINQKKIKIMWVFRTSYAVQYVIDLKGTTILFFREMVFQFFNFSPNLQ